MRHVVPFSAGTGSWKTAKVVAARHGTDNLVLMFTDTLCEDEDAYRFLIEGAANVFGIDLPPSVRIDPDQVPPVWDVKRRLRFLSNLARRAMQCIPGLVWLIDGRDIWQVFFERRFLGNSRRDPCSEALKRELAASWLEQNCDRQSTIVYVGIDISEKHRFLGGKGKAGLRALKAAEGWNYQAPLLDFPNLTKSDINRDVEAEGIDLPRLYDMGFKHNNCAGFCVKGGLGHFAHLLRTKPELYAYHEAREQELCRFLGRDDIGILTDRSGERRRPITMREFRERISDDPHGGRSYQDWGGCGCFYAA